MKQIGIYIHIPFCVKKCVYCDFLSAPADDAAKKRYMAALNEEIKAASEEYREYEVQTIFFGGGTPSCVDGELISECLLTVKGTFCVSRGAEISMELNPGTLGIKAEKTLECLLESGINRLSIGLQSADADELKILGRIHTPLDFENTYAAARSAGFKNVNIDLIFSLPGQSLEKWLKTVNYAVALNPEHMSLYSLIVEEGTYLFDHISQYPPFPDEDTDRMMYHEADRILKAHGYNHYEISNYAKKGFESRHNQIYWQRGCDHIRNYAGFGLGASSTVGNKRYKNTDDPAEYMEYCKEPEKLRREVEILSERELMEEFMFLGLRRMEGVSAAEFERTFGACIGSVYGKVLEKWKRAGCIDKGNGRYFLTEKGIDVSNVVMGEFFGE